MSDGITITVNAETAKAAAALQSFFRGLEGNLNHLTGIGELLNEIGSKLAVAFSVAGLIEMERHAINTAEEIGKLSQKTGIAVETLSAFKDQAHGLGVPFEQLDASLGLFADKIFQTVRIGGQAGKVFQDIKVRLVDANGNMRSTSAILGDVMDRFQKTIPQWEKAGVATELFGRSGRELIPILNEGAEGLEKMRQAGGGISPEVVTQATEFNRALREVQLSFEKIFRQLSAEILPTLKEFAEWLQQVAGDEHGAGSAAAVLATTFRALATVVLALKAALMSLGEYIEMALGTAIENIVDAVETAVEMMKVWLEGIKGLAGGLVDLAKAASGTGMVIVKALSGDLKGAAEAFQTTLSGVKDEFVKLSAGMVENVARAEGLLQGLFDRTRARGTSAWQLLIQGMVAEWKQFAQTVNGIWGPREAAAPHAGEGHQPPGGAGEKAPVSEEAKQLIQSVDKAFAEATQGKLALLDEEERELKKKIDQEVLDVTKAEEEKAKVTTIYAQKRKEVLKQQADAQYEIELAAIQGRRQLLEKDPDLTASQKKEKLLDLLRLENTLLEKNIALNEKRVADLSLSPEAHLAAVKQLQQEQNQHALLQEQISTTSAQGTFGGEFRRVLVDLGNEWDSWAKQAADSFKSVFETAIQSISNGITGLIMGTRTWGQALMDIGRTILTSIVQAIIQMGVRWVLTQIMMATVGKALQAASVASSAPMAAAASAIWAAPATLAATATFGAAAAMAPAEILAAQAEVMGESIAAFEKGGRPPVGRVSLVGEKGPELFVADRPGTIVPASQTAALLHGAKQSNDTNLNVGVFHDQRMFEDWARSQEGRAVLVDVYREHAHQIT